jgi:ABC-2 type transport system ATP-binding protein
VARFCGVEVMVMVTLKESNPVVPPAISVRGVVRRYGDVTALRGVDLDVPRGALCGLIGQNGAGKTTLLSILATLDDAFDGEVRVDGVDIKERPDEARRRIGFVPDHTAIYDALTVDQYLAFFAAASGVPKPKRAAAVDEVLTICDLRSLRQRPAGGLSKGLTQRLCVARALLHHPKVLLLDEPASGLDPRARIELKELLKKLAKDGVTVLISSHILTELGDFCDHVIVIKAGRVKAADRVEHLFARASGQHDGLVPRRRLLVEVVGDAQRAVAIVSALPLVFEVHRDGQMLALSVAVGGREAAQVVRALVEGGVDVGSVVPERQNLEALFLSITASTARPEDVPVISRPPASSSRHAVSR